ncbi:MAG: YtxH domain-containing protein [Rhodothermales bacterium]|jgi:gas vesicle protein
MKNDSWTRSARSGLWGVLIGGAAGFALGLIFAPEEGKRLRRKLAYQLDHLGEQVASFVEKALDEDLASQARAEGDALIKDAKEKADKIRTDIDALLGEMRQQHSDS